jgi:hypothetical protein
VIGGASSLMALLIENFPFSTSLESLSRPLMCGAPSRVMN